MNAGTRLFSVQSLADARNDLGLNEYNFNVILSALGTLRDFRLTDILIVADGRYAYIQQ